MNAFLLLFLNNIKNKNISKYRNILFLIFFSHDSQNMDNRNIIILLHGKIILMKISKLCLFIIGIVLLCWTWWFIIYRMKHSNLNRRVQNKHNNKMMEDRKTLLLRHPSQHDSSYNGNENLQFHENVYIVVHLSDHTMANHILYIMRHIFNINDNNTYNLDYNTEMSNDQSFRKISSLAMDGVLPRIDAILMNDNTRIKYFVDHTSEEPFFKASSIIEIYNNYDYQNNHNNIYSKNAAIEWYDRDDEKYMSFIKKLKNTIERTILDIL